MSDTAQMPDQEPEGPRVPPQPRGRGRPPGSRNKPRDIPSDASAAAPSATDEKPRKRKKSGSFSAEIVAATAKQIQGLHAVAAAFTGVPVLNISDQEAMALASAGLALTSELDVEIDPMWAAVFSFVGTAAIIYIPRVPHIQAHIAARRAAARSPAAQPEPGATVGPIIPGEPAEYATAH